MAGLILMLSCGAQASAASFEDQVLDELNRARADPAGMARDLERNRPLQDMDTRKDPRALDEAIAFLRRQPPLSPLREDDRLAQAAFDHVRDQGPTGQLGHGAVGALGRRIQARGVWAGLAGETISYGQDTPRDVVRQLVIDFGVPDRGHRELLFSEGFQVAGVACGPHAAWGEMCVIDLAGAFPPP